MTYFVKKVMGVPLASANDACMKDLGKEKKKGKQEGQSIKYSN